MQMRGMQQIAAIPWQSRMGVDGNSASPIKRVPDERVVDRCQMNAYLVGTSCFNFDFKQRFAFSSLECNGDTPSSFSRSRGCVDCPQPRVR